MTALPTTYATLPDGTRVGFTAQADRAAVWLTTATANLGGYNAERFGPDPFTPSGRLTAAAMRHFIREHCRA